ncbi:MAG: hypothetical protein U0800_27345 [Isosphaeraceae bacterium]
MDEEPTDNGHRNGPRRERSARYPGATLADSLELCRGIAERGLDGLPAADIAQAFGYTSIKTNTFSARLSAARQFGLLTIQGDGYALTSLARSILHPVEPESIPRLYRQALLTPPLYAELAIRLADKKVPELAILGNLLYHHHDITRKAKEPAAQAFLESARFAGALSEDGVFRARESSPSDLSSNATPIVGTRQSTPVAQDAPSSSRPESPLSGDELQITLKLWGTDRGKVITIRSPESMTPESYDRLLQVLKLHVRIDPSP